LEIHEFRVEGQVDVRNRGVNGQLEGALPRIAVGDISFNDVVEEVGASV